MVRRHAPALVLRAFWAFLTFTCIAPMVAFAAPFAAYVIDARSGQVIYEENAHTRLHPASLTKMMTLYVAFQAIENGEISLDTPVRISQHAASEPPSKLGMRPGQTVQLRYLIRAAAIKSANDAATAIGEAISGSEAAFSARMTKTAKTLGMTKSTFKNANGLTRDGHLSTAHDMTILGRHLFYDFPAYYNLFSRRTEDAGIRQVNNTNTRFLANYRGADGIKTGYTVAAGFNLVASAERGGVRIITTVFGGQSTAQRNAKVAKLMDLGFAKAPNRVAVQKPSKPAPVGRGVVVEQVEVASADPTAIPPAGKTERLVTTLNVSPRPRQRPQDQAPVETVIALDLKDDINAALEQAHAVSLVETDPATSATPTAIAPKPRPAKLAAVAAAVAAPAEKPKVISRISTSDSKNWGINVGRFSNRYAAEKMLLKTALAEVDSLGGSLRKVQQSSKGFEATFLGLTQDRADQACKRLKARDITCSTIDPS